MEMDMLPKRLSPGVEDGDGPQLPAEVPGISAEGIAMLVGTSPTPTQEPTVCQPCDRPDRSRF